MSFLFSLGGGLLGSVMRMHNDDFFVGDENMELLVTYQLPGKVLKKHVKIEKSN